MSTKIVAARLATSAGVMTVITRSSNPGNVVQIVRYIGACKKHTWSASPPAPTPDETTESVQKSATTSPDVVVEDKPPLHTRFLPLATPISDRYFWLLHGLAPHGTVYIDMGAHHALADKAGLLPVGVLDVEGTFAQQEAVRLVAVSRRSEAGADGRLWEGTPVEVGRALVNYASTEIARIKGHRSSEIEDLLGYADTQYVAHRENVSLFRRDHSGPTTPVVENGGTAGYGPGPQV